MIILGRSSSVIQAVNASLPASLQLSFPQQFSAARADIVIVVSSYG
jgi:hypothetical protein